jgi:hypothetical protein
MLLLWESNVSALAAMPVRPTESVCSPGRCVRFPTGLCADVSKADVLPLGSPSFSTFRLKEKDLAEDFGSGTMYENVARHAWSPPNFPHSDKEAKVRTRPSTSCSKLLGNNSHTIRASA